MKSTILLRIASILTVLHFAGHTFGGVFGTPTPEQAAVLEVMKSHHFILMGSSRSYWDFHLGFGLFVSVMLLVEAALFWQLSTMVKTNPQQARPIIALFSVAFAAFAILSWKYFFIAPLVLEIIIAICLAWAWRAAQPGRSV